MKRLRFALGLLCAALLLVVGLPAGGVQAGTQDFTINSFDADYYLSKNDRNAAQLTVVEKITAEFPDYDQNHGILRALPNGYLNYKKAPTIKSVQDGSGNDRPYGIEQQNGNTILRIGDADTYVHGTQVYRIEYSQPYVINTTLSEHDEFFWDINGNEWPQTFGAIEARVHIPAELREQLLPQQKCYSGAAGSMESKCMLQRSNKDGGVVVDVRTNGGLAGYETLSVVLAFKKGTFAGYEPSLYEKIRPWLLFVSLGVVPPLTAVGVMYRRWRHHGRDPKGRGTIVPEYLTPKDESVLLAATVYNFKTDPHIITAQVLDLAVRHYLKIYEIKQKKRFQRDSVTYEIEIVRDISDLRAEEKAVVMALFDHKSEIGARINLDMLKTKLSSEASAIGKQVGGMATAQEYYRSDPMKAMAWYIVIGVALMVVGFVFVPYLIGVAVAGAIVLGFGFAMPARTEKGVALREYLLGLKMYMEVAESERIKMMQSPQGRYTQKVDVSDKKQLVTLYEKLLPYAVVFGIEKEWAEQFAALYDQPPTWYSGSSGVFHAAAFSHAIGGFSTASLQSFSSPSSSSGSGFGGGGGGAGGGGGGGGGGGW